MPPVPGCRPRYRRGLGDGVSGHDSCRASRGRSGYGYTPHQLYGSRHSEAIITRDYEAARRFENEIDAAAVYVNASTRFTDGFQFGLGAEIGISTQKLHARGPMGLEEMTTYKYVINGDGQVRP